MSLNTTAVRIKVTLKDVKPEVMRRLVVPLTLRLDRLHLTPMIGRARRNNFWLGDGTTNRGGSGVINNFMIRAMALAAEY